MKERLRKLLLESLKKWDPDFVPPPFEIERPKVKLHGELSTNLAMVMAKSAGSRPRELASLIAALLSRETKLLEKVEVAGGGFINVTFQKSAWQESLSEIDRCGERFGCSQEGGGEPVVVEFVSANPTGPLHIGNARGGPLGDVIANLLEAMGHKVVREYYVNDVGGQIAKLGESLLAELQTQGGREVTVQEIQYQGETIQRLASLAREKFGEENSIEKLGRFGVETLLEEIRADCEAIGIRFQSWIYESQILAGTENTVRSLEANGVTRLNEGALWLAPQDEFLQDRECVLRKTDGRPTYFANDITYHAQKFRRGFARLINIWGANHHGHLPRLQAALAALGHDPSKLQTVFYQTVRLKRGGEVVAMSKRAGNLITAREVLEEVGIDALRFFLLMRAPESHLDFDLELAKRHTQENPVYYVQYAHARLASIFRKAEALQLPSYEPKLELLELPEEIELIRLIHEFPEEVSLAAHRLEPHRIPFYLLELSRAFQAYYTRAKEDPNYRVLGSEVDTTLAKLYLCKILKRTLANGLKLLGVSAPEVMQSE